jgi:hypothetical protein
MSPAPDPHPEDQRVVAVELLVHLRELRSREIVDPRQLAEVWLQLRHCDSAALDSLEPTARDHYLSIVEVPRRPRPPLRQWDRAALRIGAAHLRVALHRRLMVLESVLNERTAEPGRQPEEGTTSLV